MIPHHPTACPRTKIPLESTVLAGGDVGRESRMGPLPRLPAGSDEAHDVFVAATEGVRGRGILTNRSGRWMGHKGADQSIVTPRQPPLPFRDCPNTRYAALCHC